MAALRLGGERAGEHQRRPGIDLEIPLQPFDLDRLERVGREDGGVVDENLDLPERVAGAFNQAYQLSGIGEIGAERNRL
jgi:hypothetical protein